MGVQSLNQVLEAADPVRDVKWWTRTAIYWFVVIANNPAPHDFPTWLRILTWIGLAATMVAVYFRDRYPWLVCALALLLGASVAESPIAAGVAVFASRAKPCWTYAYCALAALALAIPSQRPRLSALTIQSDGPGAPLVYYIAVVVFLVVIPALIGSLRRSQRLAERQRLDFETQARELAADQAAATERGRIAQEMHDVLGHKLSLLTLQAGALEVNADAGPEVVGQLAEQIRSTSQEALNDLRSVLGLLGEDGETRRPQPGIDEVEQLISYNRNAGMQVSFDNELSQRPPQALATAVYRIVQEGLTNAHRHSPGAAVKVTTAGGPGGTLTVRILNRPSSRPDTGPGLGRGLAGMRERVRVLDGTFDAGPTDEGGFHLEAAFPWPAAEGASND